MATENSSIPAVPAITLEDIEAIVAKLEADDCAEREHLFRLIRAYARILSLREPSLFPRMPLEHADEDGHYDNSFPPDQVYKDRRGPRLLEVDDCETTDIATTVGFYYAWRRETTDRGVFVSPTGELWGCEEAGTGRLGQFAAHPGDCDVRCSLEWEPLEMDEVETERLKRVERALRGRAFPSSRQ